MNKHDRLQRTIFIGKTFFLVCIILIFSILPKYSFAQTEDDLTEDYAFFREQLYRLRQEIKSDSLHRFIKIRDLKVYPDSLHLQVESLYSDPDSTAAALPALNEAFNLYRHSDFEEYLIWRTAHLCRIDARKIGYEFRHSFDKKEANSLTINYLWEKDTLRQKTERLSFRKKQRLISVKFHELRLTKKISTAKIKNALSKHEVYAKIIDFAKKKYAGSEAKFLVLENQKTLRFEVSDLRREVLIDEADPLLARVLKMFGKEVNWVKRELLTFTITRRETEDGIELDCQIQGQYGSGYYSHVKRGAYIEMEPDFEVYLERYSDAFSEEIRRCLILTD